MDDGLATTATRYRHCRAADRRSKRNNWRSHIVSVSLIGCRCSVLLLYLRTLGRGSVAPRCYESLECFIQRLSCGRDTLSDVIHGWSVEEGIWQRSA